MAKKDFTTPLSLNGLYPNLDDRYTNNGDPYVSKNAAETALASKLNAYHIGLTVLVKESGWTEANEYWVQPKGTTPETYGLVEKGAGTTDYNDLENKPTISDGGQGSAQIPLTGNVKVTAKAATSGQTTGVAVTAENGGGITMAFTLEKGADGVNGTNGTNGTNGIDGKSAYQQWLDEGNTGDETDFLNSLKAQIGKFIYAGYNATAAALSIGGTTTESLATGATNDSIVLMPNNDATAGTGNPTATMMFSVSVSGDQTPVTTYTYIGDVNVDASTFIGTDKIVQDLRAGGTGNVPSAAAVKELNERLYGSHDNSTSEEITLSSPTVGLFLNPSVESGNAYASSSGNGRKGMIAPEAFAGIKSYKFLRVTQGENYGGITFVKKEAPSSSMTYQALVDGGYLSSVHDSYENVVINLPANTTTDIAIPEDAYTAYFLYRRAADGSGVDGTYRKPTMVVGYGLKTEGELEEIWEKIREMDGGDGGSEEPIDGADILDGTVGGEKLIHATEEHMPFSLIDYDSLVGGTLINSIGDVVEVEGQNYRATNFIKLMGKKVFWYGMGSYGSTAINGGALYDKNKNVLRVFRPGATNNFDPNNTEDPNYVEGAAYIRLTLTGAGSLHYCVYAKADGTNPMADQSGISTDMIDGYYRVQVIHHADVNITFPKENVPELIPALSMAGQNGFSKTVAAVGPGQEATYVEVADTEYPSFVKCCHTISFKGFLGTLGESDIIRFGIRRNSTTGKVVDITGTQVKIMRYDRNYGYVENVTFTHGLTISDFIMCEVSFDWHGGKIRLISREGAFVQGWQNTQYANQDNPQINYGRVFLEPTVVLSNVKLSQSSDRFMKPVWVIGDSYTSMSSKRWTWQLINNFGIDGFLLSGYAGATSGAMVAELQMLLRYGTPKYLYWCLGMNDGPVIWKCCATKVEMLCRERGITLIYQTIPRNVPDQGEGVGKKGIINNYIKESGCRYVDVFSAVTENKTTGEWYEGMMDDETHPSVLGAQVIAGQVLVDFPEIANYK